MKNKKILIGLVIVLATTAVIYSFTNGSSHVEANTLFQSKKFNDNTYIGAIDLSNLKKKEAEAKLLAELASLSSSTAINLTYLDVTVSLPPEVISFEVKKTMQAAKSGETTPIFSIVSTDGLKTVLKQNFELVVFQDEEVALISRAIEKKLEVGTFSNQIQLTDYLAQNQLNVVSQSAFSISNPSPAFTQLLRGIDGKQIGPYERFSLLGISENSKVITTLTDNDFTQLSSLLYSAILKTNFIIDSRHIGRELNAEIPLGFEAVINRNMGIDLKFTNPNKASFTINSVYNGDTYFIELMGLPFINSFDVHIDNIQEYNPRTIKQFSSFVSKGEVRVKDEGQQGRSIDVYRTISRDGREIEKIYVSNDFYAPLQKIEQHPLYVEEQTSETDVSSGREEGDGSDGSSNGDIESNEDLNDDNKIDENDEVQYDKGGNIIN